MLAWLSDLNPRERRSMTACFGGWSLDARDVQIVSFVIPALPCDNSRQPEVRARFSGSIVS